MHCHVLGSVDLDYKTYREGSFLKPFSYTDVNECQTGSYSCHAQGQCVNVPGSYSCKCLPGYTGDGKSRCEGTYFQNLISIKDCYIQNANVFKGRAISIGGGGGCRGQRSGGLSVFSHCGRGGSINFQLTFGGALI